MARFSWARWLRSLLRPQVKPYRRRPRYHRVSLEQLETRLSPATFYWSSTAPSASWKNPSNWVGGVAPTDVSRYAFLADLVFPASSTTLSTLNDITGLVVKSISIVGSGYTLGGTQQITLGDPSVVGSGTITDSAGTLTPGETISLPILLGGASGSQQFFTVAPNTSLTISGVLSGSTGSELTKDGQGTLYLTRDNSAFTGPFTIKADGGIVSISNSYALGSIGTAVTVGTNAQLQLSTNINVPQTLTLNGIGIINNGSLYNASGNNTWSGPIRLDTDVYLGGNAGTLNITGQISDLGSGHNLTKVGTNQIYFSSANTYRGTTTIQNGILTIRDPQALGATSSGTVVLSDVNGTGRLELDANNVWRIDPATGQLKLGFTVLGEQLTLNGQGYGNVGALYNATGDNTWAGRDQPNDLLLASGVYIGAATVDGKQTNLTISGIISGGGSLGKVGTGRVIFNNANTYTNSTTVWQGTLQIDDSRALGTSGSTRTVWNGAALELAVDSGVDANGRDLGHDSVTGVANMLALSVPLDLYGMGVANTGALRNVSGINTWSGDVTLRSTAAIGVEPDQNPKTDLSYFNSDWSLTVTGDLSGSAMRKVGQGQLILPYANPNFTSYTYIDQGWVTIQNNRSLGPPLNVADTQQPQVIVASGAALHLLPLNYTTGGDLDLFGRLLVLSGTGITHPFGLINQAGALQSLAGVNTINGIVRFNGDAGIGVEQVDLAQDANGYLSELTLLNTLQDNTPTSGGLIKLGSRILYIQSDGTYTGPVDIRAGVLRNQNNTGLGAPGGGGVTVRSGAALELAGTVANFQGSLQSGIQIWGKTLTLNGPGNTFYSDYPLVNLTDDNMWWGPTILNSSTTVDVKSGSRLTLYGGVSDASTPADLAVTGGGYLALAGAGSYRGMTYINAGVVTVQNSGALGGPGTGQMQTITIPAGTTGTYNLSFWDGSAWVSTSTVYAGGIPWNAPAVGQSVTITGSTGLTTFTLSFGSGPGSTTAPLAYGASATQVQTALNGLSTIGGLATPGSVSVFRTVPASGTGYVYSIVFGGSLAGTLQTLTASAIGGTGPSATVVGPGVQEVLNALLMTISSAAGGSVRVGQCGDVYTLTYQGTLAGLNWLPGFSVDSGLPTNAVSNMASGAVIVADGAQLQLQGNLTIAGKPLILQGQGGVPATIPYTWISMGPAPINSGPTAGGAADVTGRVTSVAVDPSDANTIYIATAGGGAWKTKNGGSTWQPLFDNYCNGAGIPMFSGTITAASSNVIYFGTGEANNSNESYYGSGVYISTDAGSTWTLISGTMFQGKAITQIAVDPLRIDTIYVSVADAGANGIIGTGGGTSIGNGIFKCNTTNTSPQWTALVAGGTGANRAFDDAATPFLPTDQYTAVGVMLNPVASVYYPGPTYPNYVGSGTYVDWNNYRWLFFSIGNPNPVGNNSRPNGVYISLDNLEAFGSPISTRWFEGQNLANPLGAGLFPMSDSNTIGSVTVNTPHSGLVKMAYGSSLSTGFGSPNMPVNTGGPSGAFSIYGAVIYPMNGWEGNPGALKPTGYTGPYFGNQFREIQKNTITWNSTTAVGGIIGNWQINSWAATPTPNTDMCNLYGNSANSVSNAQGLYDLAIAVDRTNPQSLVVGGMGEPAGSGPYRSADGGSTWIDIGSGSPAPHNNYHALALSGATVVAGTDGGVWRFSGGWSNLNGNLAITQFDNIAVNPSDPLKAIGGSQGNGVDLFNNNRAWTWVNGGSGGNVQYKTSNLSTVYAVSNAATGPTGYASVLVRSTDGGATWSSTLLTDPFTTGFPFVNFPFAVDSVNPERIVAGSGKGFGGQGFLFNPGPFQYYWRLVESLDGGTNWTSLSAPAGFNPTDLALATYQGKWTSDPTRFSDTNVPDKGANTYDPDTIYITDGTSLMLTKDHTLSGWKSCALPAGLPAGYTITDIAVDPASRDTIYIVVVGEFNGAGTVAVGRVYKSTLAGVTAGSWTSLSPTSLPAYSVAWDLVIDPRTTSVIAGENYSTLYLGTDVGVYMLKNGAGSWQPLGEGLPNVQVRDLQLNQTLNTLTAGTYGRGMYEIFLDDALVQSSTSTAAGTLVAISGTSSWTGPVYLDRASSDRVIISANGNQALQNGVAIAQLDIVGTISDLSSTPATLVKWGNGNLMLSGANTYMGNTDIQQGVVIVHNHQALGTQTSGPTIVRNGTALQLQTNLDYETVLLYGDGISYNGRNTGALRNFSNNNTFTGTLILQTNSTIGVDTGSSLTIGTIPGSTGTIQGNYTLTKELTGTLVLATANSYTGGTLVNAGIVQVQNNNALGTGSLTTVVNGAQLQMLTPQGSPPVTVTGQTLQLTGTGINGTGVLLGVGGENHWNGPVWINPATAQYATISLGESGTDPGDVLYVDGVINQTNLYQGITKVGLGRVTLNNANLYSGTTTVAAGILRIQNASALGTTQSGTVVNSGAALELDLGAGGSVVNEALALNGFGPQSQQISVSGTAGTFTLTFNGQTTSGSLNFGDAAVQVQAALTALSTIGGAGGSVTVTYNSTSNVYTVIFGGSLNDQAQPLISFNKVTGDLVATVSSGGLTASPAAAVQQYSVANTSGTYTLTFNGVTTVPLGYNAPATGTKMQTVIVSGTAGNTFSLSLNGGTSISEPYGVSGAALQSDLTAYLAAYFSGSNYGPVAVSQDGDTYTVTFSGTASPPVLTHWPTDTAGVTISSSVQNALNDLSSIGGVGGSVAVTRTGSQYTVTFGGSLSLSNQPLITAFGTAGPTQPVVVTPGSDGSGVLHNISGNNAWNGPITLQSNSSICVDPGSSLTPSVVQDAPVRSFALSGTSGGMFRLQYNLTQKTGWLSYGATAAQVQAALNVLTNLTTVGGSAIVTQIGNAYTISFINVGTTVDLAVTDYGSLTVTYPAYSPVAAEPASLIKVGQGTLNLHSANSYLGETFINTGPLNIDKAGALGGANSEIQQVTVYGTAGTFTLTFNGATTVPLGFNAPATGTRQQTVVVQGQSGQAFTLSLDGGTTSISAPYGVPGITLQNNLNIYLATYFSGSNYGTATVNQNGNIYTVTFSGPASPPEMTHLASDTARATISSSVQNALQALPTIGGVGGSVSFPFTSVQDSIGTSIYQIRFGGALANMSLPQLIPAWANGTSGREDRLAAGSAGTVVNSGGVLQIQGGITVSLEALTLNGPGTSLPNDGALQNINSDNTWAGLIVLGSQAAIGSDLNTLTITGQIVDTGNGYGIVAPSLGYGVTKVGPDIVQFKPGQGNTYTGPTLVDDGTLQLNNQGGAGTYAVKGNLTVGDGNGNLLTDIAILMGDNQINPSSTLTVNSDGLFNLNGKMQTIAGLTMTGGTVDVKGGQLTLGGNVTAQADSTGAPAIITDTNFATPGSVLLGPSGVTNRTFTVNRTGTGLPVLPADMVISAVLNQANPTVTDLTKLGAGTLQLTRSNLYTGLTHPTAGVLVVDGTIADVELNGGTLAGTGTVGNITTTAAGGTVAPGDLPAPGALTCTSVTWNITDLFHLLLSPPGYSGQSNRLIVTGNVVLGDADPGPGGLYNINNAKLDPSSEVGTTAEGNAFLIMTYTGTLTGHFLEQYSSNTVFLAGQKFSVDYTTTPGQIWLTRTLNTATLTLTPSLTSPILYGQDISFTATVTPEPGASASLTTSDQVAFTFSVHGGPTSVSYVNLNSSGQATLDPKIFFGNLPVPVVVGTPNYYDVTVDFTKDGYTSPPSETSSLQVNPTATSVNVSSTWSTAPSPLVYGQTVTITATVSPKSTVPPQLPSALRPSGTVTFTVDPGPSQQQVSAVLDTNGQASINLPGDLPSLTTGSHTVQVAYVDLSGGGDGNYQDSNTLAGYLVTVSRGPVDFSILPDPLSSSFGEPVTLTATVTARSPSTGTTQQRVVVEGTPGVDTFSLSLDGGATFISETCGVSDSQLQTDLNDYLNTNFPGGIYGTATVSQFNNNTYLVTFFGGTTPPPLMENLPAGTATVTIDTTSNPGGKVYFYDGSIPLGWSDVDINTGQASINTILTVGTHTINAAYSPDSNYSSASASYTNYVVSKGDTTTTIISSPNYSVYGQIVTVTATVTIGAAHNPFVPQTGIANGTVSFYLDGGTTPIGTTGVDNTGKAKVLLSSTLGIGTHQITATYNGNANFNASDPSDVLDQVVKSATTSTLGVTPTSSPYYGLQTVTLTATVKPSGTGAGVAPTGSVNFYDGSTLLNPTPIPVNVVSGTTVQAEFTLSYPTNPLAAGSHQLKAVYLGDGDPYYSSSTSPTKLYTVLQAVTTTSLVVTPGDPTGYGDQLTFTATIGLAPSQGGGTPTGAVNFVNFYDGATLLNPSPVPLTGNQAEFTTITPLAKGSHSIQARYTSDDANYKNSVSALVSRTVTLATTTTTLTPGLASPATYGNASMTFTATVDPTNPLSGTPTGSVEFYDGATKIATVPLTGGQAVLTPPPFLTGGLHNLQARYTGNPSAFSGSNSTVLTDYQVDKAATTTTLSSSAPGSIGQGQSVTFTAVVSGVGTAPGVANPTGTVVFYDGGIAKYTFNLTSTSGPAKWTTSSLIFGTHTITATYNPGSNPNYLTSTSDPLEQKVLKPTSTSVVAAPTSSTYGGLVTFTATVISTTNGGNPTSGTVTFYDGATQIGTPVDLIGTNQASINTNTLTGGAHTIKAVYSGDGTTYAASTGMRSFTVNRAVSSITVDLPAPTSSTYGQQVTLTATVSPTTLPLTATGTVTFKANNVIVGIYILQAADAGVATLQVTNIGAGTKTITATYSGDTNFTADSTSNTQSLTVNKAQSTTVVTSSAPGNTTPYGQLVNFYVTVTNKDYPAVGTPSGTVTFWDGPVGTGIKLNTTPVSLNAAGIAALSTGALSEGVHDINASFTAASSGNFLNSESEVALEYTVTASQVASLTASLLNSSGKAVTSVATNTAFSISVLARDASGNTLTTYSAPVTMTTITAPAGGVLTGRFSSTFINGKATFAGLKATKAGTYTVKVTSGGKETTFTFTVTATGRLL